MKTEYEINAEFQKDVNALVEDKTMVEFNPIREQELRIVAVVCIRTNNEGEHEQPKGCPVKCTKLSPIIRLLTEHHYLVVGDYYFWTHANEIQKKAAIHRALMSINVEKSKTGEIKLKTRKPEIQEHRATIARFGAFSEELVDMKEAFKMAAKQFTESQKPKA
jgi:hypothetical protein